MFPSLQSATLKLLLLTEEDYIAVRFQANDAVSSTMAVDKEVLSDL